MKRRESNVSQHLREHMAKIIDTAVDLDKAFMAALANKRPAILDALRTLRLDEKAANNLEVVLFEDLSKGELEPKQREELMRLVRRIDDISEWVEQAALSLELLMESRKIVPREYWSDYKNLSGNLVSETKALRGALEAFGRDDHMVLKQREEIKRLEQTVDDEYFQTRKKLINSAANPKAMVTLSDMLSSIEEAADMAMEAADTLYILVMANR